MTINPSVGLLNFGSQKPADIILEMFRIRQRMLLGEKIEMPQITLLLWPEGNQITGFILDIKDEKSDQHVAIQLAGQNAGSLFYSYLGAIRGVVVHDIERYEHLLTEVNAQSKMNKLPTTTRLEIKKCLDSEAKSLSEKVESSISYSWQGDLPEDKMVLFVMSNLITDVTICLKEISQTELGKQAVAESISKVIFIKDDSQFSLSKDKNELILKGKFDKSFTTSQGRRQLKEKLESFL